MFRRNRTIAKKNYQRPQNSKLHAASGYELQLFTILDLTNAARDSGQAESCCFWIVIQIPESVLVRKVGLVQNLKQDLRSPRKGCGTEERRGTRACS